MNASACMQRQAVKEVHEAVWPKDGAYLGVSVPPGNTGTREELSVRSGDKQVRGDKLNWWEGRSEMCGYGERCFGP